MSQNIAQKYWELKTLSEFRKNATVDGVVVDFAFGDNSFRYWHGSTVIKFDFSKTEDVDRFLATTFLINIGDVEV